jgi:carbonic anhydrase/acetyltransferase-like protein (isoleucine patch superfamily)
MTLYRLGTQSPQLGEGAWVAPSAQVMGDVHLGVDSNIWFNVVIRGDNETIRIGQGTNVQDGSVLHSDVGSPLSIGDHVTVGHNVILHGCTVGEGTLIGMGAVVLNGAKIGPHCLVGAGALVTEGKEFPEGSMILGSPAKVVKSLSPEQIDSLKKSAVSYVENAKRFQAQLSELDPQI